MHADTGCPGTIHLPVFEEFQCSKRNGINLRHMADVDNKPDRWCCGVLCCPVLRCDLT
eukprot:COSAG02_NODE_3390_length_6822_cov_7.140860_2_plen_58_part_00